MENMRVSLFLGGFEDLVKKTGVLLSYYLVDPLEPQLCFLDVFPQCLILEFYDLLQLLIVLLIQLYLKNFNIFELRRIIQCQSTLAIRMNQQFSIQFLLWLLYFVQTLYDDCWQLLKVHIQLLLPLHQSKHIRVTSKSIEKVLKFSNEKWITFALYFYLNFANIGLNTLNKIYITKV